ncbi:MAG: response regulator transcription factor [Barnesiella sp.]|nr:response regulator transcription factor [Barnesiella sp.]
MSQNLKCIIIDDEPLARELIKSYIDKTPALTLAGSFESAAEAVKAVMEEDIQLVFLDINMPMLNGIDFAKVIPPKVRIIYITAYEQYAVDGYRVNALDYLLKPVNYAEFLQSVGKAIEWFTMVRAAERNTREDCGFITVKADYRLIHLNLDNILYAEVRKDHIIFFRKDGDPVSSLMSMREVEEMLPPWRFMRVHRSFIVNLHNVEVVERGRIVFGKEYIPISESHREEFLARLGKD